jgi:hypothetical protein
MFEFLKSESFKIIGSAVIGVGIVAVLKPICKGDECIIQKAPAVDEVTKSTYQIGSKCYKFTTTQLKCPERGIIEPFSVAA